MCCCSLCCCCASMLRASPYKPTTGSVLFIPAAQGPSQGYYSNNTASTYGPSQGYYGNNIALNQWPSQGYYSNDNVPTQGPSQGYYSNDVVSNVPNIAPPPYAELENASYKDSPFATIAAPSSSFEPQRALASNPQRAAYNLPRSVASRGRKG